MIAPTREAAPTPLVADRQRWLGRLERAARRVRGGGDPGSVHDVRVATRQLDASLDLCRAILPRRRRRRARRALGTLRSDLASARDVRIGLDLLHERITTLPPPARVAAALLEDFLNGRLGRLEARAARRCSRPAIARIRRRIELAWEDVTLEPDRATSVLESGRARLARRRRAGHLALRDAAAGGSNRQLHSARVAAKRWRYLLERLATTDPTTDVSERAWLKAVQDSLGRIQDLSVLRRRIMRLTPRLAAAECGAASEPMRSLLESIQAEHATCVRTFCVLAASAAPGPRRPIETAPPPVRSPVA